MAAGETESLRLDKWLWYARLCKTRSGAQRLCEADMVELNGVPAQKAAQKVRIGDQLTLRFGSWRVETAVTALGTRRGPAPEARLLYRELSRERVTAHDARAHDARAGGARAGDEGRFQSLFDLEAFGVTAALPSRPDPG